MDPAVSKWSVWNFMSDGLLKNPVCVLFKSFHSRHLNIIRLCSLLRKKPVYPHYIPLFEKQSFEYCEELLRYNEDHFEGFSEVGNQDPCSLGSDSVVTKKARGRTEM